MAKKPVVAGKTEVKDIELKAIEASATNPRKHFDDSQLQDLANSIKDKGVIEPLLVKLENEKGERSTYSIVCGERRYRAAKLAGLATVPCIVRELTDQQVCEIQIIENMQRTDLSPLEEAQGYKMLHEKYGHDWDELAARIGKSKSYIYHRLQLLNLIPEIQKGILDGSIPVSWAEELVRVTDKKAQKDILENIILDDCGCKPENAKELRNSIEEKYLLFIEQAPFNTADTKAPGGACTACTKRTGSQPGLFADATKKNDTCLDIKCWAEKVKWDAEEKVKAYQAKGKEVLTGKKAEAAIKAMPKMDDNAQWINGKMTTWKDIAGKDYEPVLAIDGKGNVIKLVDKKTLPPKKKTKAEIEQEAKNEKEQLEGKIENIAKPATARRMKDEIVKEMKKQYEGSKTRAGVMGIVFGMMIEKMRGYYDGFGAEDVIKEMKIDVKPLKEGEMEPCPYEKALDKILATEPEMVKLEVMIRILAGEFNQYNASPSDELLELYKTYGKGDWKKIYKEEFAKAKAEVKESSKKKAVKVDEGDDEAEEDNAEEE